LKIRMLLGTVIVVVILTTQLAMCGASESSTESDRSGDSSSHLVTFIELGSVNCIPCRMMQPVMDQLEENFPNDVRVLFYDVWTEEQSHFADEYNIRVIPTQVFLDEKGEEFFRHEGFFPYDQIVEILSQKGVKR
jgi:thioredoxin 1